jgi:hypothetical protein
MMPEEEMESVREAFASISEVCFWWPQHTQGHDKYAAFKTLMQDRQNKPDEVIWFLLTYVFDLERRFSALRMAVVQAAGDAPPNSDLANILEQEEQHLNVNPATPYPPLEHWENLARIAGAQMKAWAERVNPEEPDSTAGASSAG